ncbi:PrsW family intramembrane metalloprotease [Leptolyngbya sp. AN02str]|uniref:PrsW family intramembrane metalloprotease n=1 Tax=Leptolyngbya sp. AN02str TaxID=3423363 RepID=UPI003D31BD56
MTQSNRDRLFYGSPLKRNALAIIVLSVLVLALVLAFFNLLAALAAFKPEAVTVFFQALLLSSLLSLVPIAVLWYLDRRERESPLAMLTAFLWGGVIATGLSLPINSAIILSIQHWLTTNPTIGAVLGSQAALLLGAPLAGPLVEETIKGLGILALLLILSAEFDNMRDGFIYGALVGIGFNCLESALYVAQSFAAFDFAPWGLQLGARYSLFGLSGHALFSGLLGLFLGWAIQTTQGWLRILAPIVGWILAIAAHALSNALPLLFTLAGAQIEQPTSTEAMTPPNPSFLEAFLQRSVLDLVLFVPFWALIALLLWRSGIWERNVIREELRAEVDTAVTPEEYELIRRDGIFQTRRIQGANRRLAEALINAQNELAFRKHHVRKMGKDPNADPLVQGWREEVNMIRGELNRTKLA